MHSSLPACSGIVPLAQAFAAFALFTTLASIHFDVIPTLPAPPTRAGTHRPAHLR
jgi:hypothetical protein